MSKKTAKADSTAMALGKVIEVDGEKLRLSYINLGKGRYTFERVEKIVPRETPEPDLGPGI